MKKLLLAVLLLTSLSVSAGDEPPKTPYQRPLFLNLVSTDSEKILASVNNIVSMQGVLERGATDIHYDVNSISVKEHLNVIYYSLNPAPFKCIGVGCDATKVCYLVPITPVKDSASEVMNLVSLHNIEFISQKNKPGSTIHNKDGSVIEIEEDIGTFINLMKGK